MVQFRIFIAFISLQLLSCKAKDPSSVKTLDNIASAKPTFDACQDNFDIHPSGLQQLQKSPHLQSALRAVPFKIQQGFFVDLTGTIQVVQKFSKEDCPDMISVDPKRADDLLGCWQRTPHQNNSIKIILRSQPRELNKEQYALVRVLGFIYGDILINRIIPDNGGPVQFGEVDPNFTLYKRGLASAFLGDLAKITPAQDKSSVSKTLAQLGISESIFNQTDAALRTTQIAQLPAAAIDKFASRVFGEAFHSRFCTVDSFKRACDKFYDTMTQFKPYADDAMGQNTASCPLKNTTTLTSRSDASSTHLGYFAKNQAKLNSRRLTHLDNGAVVNANLAASIMRNSQANALALGGLDLGNIMSLLSGGGTGGTGQGGMMGFLQMLFWTGPSTVSPYPIPTYLPNQPPIPTYIPNIPSQIPGTTPTTGTATAEETAAFNATNAYRQTQNLPALQFDQRLLDECREQAQLQASQPADKILTHYIKGAGTSTAENIAYGMSTGGQTAQQWITSEGHRQNIISQRTYMAVGEFAGGSVGPQWCQRFR